MMSREPIITEIPGNIAEWLSRLMAEDLSRWTSAPQPTLSREEATAFAMFISDSLPADCRTEVPAIKHLKAV